MNILIDLAGLALIAFIVWWFWLYRPALPVAVVHADAPVDILVADGVYTPAEIRVPVGRPTRLRFLRRDASPCAATVQVDGLGAGAELPVGRPVEITVAPAAPGRYEFACQMRMYRGVLVATEEA